MNGILRWWLAGFFLAIGVLHGQSDAPDPLQLGAEKQHKFTQQPSEGVALGESKEGQRHYGFAGRLRADGPRPDESTLFEIGSISKVFTGILLAETVRQGKAAYADPISKYLPAEAMGEDSPLDLITLESLSTHHSGLPRLPNNLQKGADPTNPYAHYDVDRLYAYLKKLKESHLKTRGKQAYSNLGVGLLGHVLELIWEKPLPELMRDTIFLPLGMKETLIPTKYGGLPEAVTDRLATGHRAGEAVSHWELGVLLGAGAIISSANDLLRFAEAHWDNETPAGLKLAMEDALTIRKGKQALGWLRTRDNQFNHNGGTGGFRSRLSIDVSKKWAEVSLQNSSGEKMDQFETKGEFSQLEGFWEGTLGGKLRLIFHFNSKGQTVLFSLDQNCSWSVANRAMFLDGELSLRFGGIEGTFEGKHQSDQIAGTWDQGRENPLTLRKLGPKAPDHLRKLMEQRVSGDLTDLDGYWSGHIGALGQLFVILEVLPVGEELSIVNFFSPTQAQKAFQADEFSRTDEQIEGKWEIFKSRLEVALDPEEKTLKGVWFQIIPQPIHLKWSEKRPDLPNKKLKN